MLANTRILPPASLASASDSSRPWLTLHPKDLPLLPRLPDPSRLGEEDPVVADVKVNIEL